MSDAYVIAGARTPIGAYLGAFERLTAPELGAAAIEAAISRAGIAQDAVDEVIMGNVVSAGVGQAPARQAALKAGLPPSVAALTVNKVCGSGLKAVMLASQAIRCGDAQAIVAGGMESMSGAPHVLHGFRSGIKLGDRSLQDAMVLDGLTCAFESCHMGMHAEHTANKFSVTRADQDAFAAESQRRAAAAAEQGIFQEEICPVVVKTRKGETTIDADEGIRAETTVDGLAKLRTVFDKEGTVTAGNASTLSDGAAAVVVADSEMADSLSGPWKARIVSSHTAGTEPKGPIHRSGRGRPWRVAESQPHPGRH